MKRFRKAIAEQTDTHYSDWEYIDGPETGVGVEQWFRNKHTGQEAYVCDDQGELSISFLGVSMSDNTRELLLSVKAKLTEAEWLALCRTFAEQYDIGRTFAEQDDIIRQLQHQLREQRQTLDAF